MHPEFFPTISKRKPTIMMVSENVKDQVFYARSVAHASETLRALGFPTNNKQIAAALNPSIIQREYLTRHNTTCATITLKSQGWRIARLGGVHKDRMVTESTSADLLGSSKAC